MGSSMSVLVVWYLADNLFGLFRFVSHNEKPRRLRSPEVYAQADNHREDGLEDQRDAPRVVSRDTGKPNHDTQHRQTTDLEACAEEANHAATEMYWSNLADVLRARHERRAEAHEKPTGDEHVEVDSTALQDGREVDDGISKEVNAATADFISANPMNGAPQTVPMLIMALTKPYVPPLLPKPK